MRSVNHKLFSLLFALLLGFGLFAQIPNRPSPPRLVNDIADVLSDSEERKLEQFLVAYDDSTSTQIVILTIPSTNGEDVILYGAEVGEAWGVGEKGKDNGIVLTVAVNDRKVGISVGYGIEEFQNAAYTKQIIDQRILPQFRNKDYFSGIAAGIDGIVSVLSGNFENENPTERSPGSKRSAFVIFLIILFFVMMSLRRGGRGGGGGLGSLATGYWLGSMGSSAFRGGGGGFGGGGGGFGGFGGGSFGGGGASGSW